jgi:tRNA nucleotidyltransferase (CCA-adding enzyme)
MTYNNTETNRQYQIYELFNCADGNDDILGDLPPQDAVDTRRGMWAQMPYNVSDGGGVINEDFISFVLARDKYPKKLPSAPFVAERFNECVSNLKEVLKHVSQKKKFYNNLLALQEVLIENKVYEKEPLLKEEYEITEATNPSRQAVKPFTLEDRNYAIELADAFAKKINLGETPAYIDGGSNGHAFKLNEQVVLKITADKSEADAAGKLLNEEPKYISKIYSFYKIIDTIKNLAFFAILQENVKDKPTAEFRRYMNIIDVIEPAGMDYVSILMMMRKKSPDEVGEVAKHIISDKPEANIFVEDRESAYDYLIDLINIQEELRSYGIKSDDYGNPSNLGYQNGVLKFFDIGGYRAHEPTMMAQDIVYLPEDGSALYSTDNAMGQDNFPAHNNIDTSPSIQNDLNANVNIEEDLEYNHVDDATKDEYMMSERKLSSMEGSSTVDVKQKCRLAGNGNTSTACNQGDINNLNIKPLKEEVNAKEMRSDIAAIKSVLSGKRGVAFVEINKAIYQKLEKKKIGVIPTRMTSRQTMMAIIYTDKVKAYLLYDIAKTRGGHLEDKTPEEARQIGKLLDYKPADIDMHIRNKYGSKVPVLPEKSPDDFDDLAEEVSYDFWDLNEEDHSEFERDIEQDLATHQLDKKFIRNYQDGDHTYSVFAVNGDQVRDSGFIEWVDGGNHWVDADLPENEQKYAKHIGENEYWIDDVFMIKPDDFEAILLHERTESYIIRHFGYEYDDAHEIANKIEMMFRKNIPNGANRAVAEKIYDTFVKNFKPKKDLEKHEPANEQVVLTEYPNQMDKVYVKSGVYDQKDRDEIMSITGGDPYTKLIADMYYYLANRYNKEMVEPTELRPRDKELLMLAHKRLKEYNKNVLPIHDLYAQEHNAHPLEKMNDLDWRELIINRIKQLPSLLVRNLRNDIRKERNHYELEQLYHTVKDIQNSIKLIGQVKPEHREKIEKKIYSSANDTFEGVKKRLEDTTIPYLSQDDAPEGIIEKVNDLGGEAEVLYNGNNILMVKINTGEAMGYIGCSSQWCFASNPQQYWDNYTSGEDGFATIVFDFNEPESEPNRMMVVLEDGQVYDMYNEFIEDGWQYLNSLGVTKYLPEPVAELAESRIFPKNKMMNEAQIMGLNYLPFKEDVEEAGGKIYSVGGAVRDEFLGKESKDLDILITGVPFEQLEQILGKYGAVNAVGKSFGVLKFKPKGASEDIDIAIPRTETPTGEGGHQGFDVKSDHSLPIEKDLERRDFTINAIAKDIEGNIVDPFGGQEDLKNKVIKVVNPQAFSDDPLRMLRAVQFASRFGFSIESETMKMIKENAGRVKEIAPERILTEFDKIVKKGNVLTGAILLDETGLLKEIFGRGLYYDFRNTKEPFDKVRTMGEFVYLLSKNLVNDPAEFFKTNLKGDENAYREIKALQLAFESRDRKSVV